MSKVTKPLKQNARPPAHQVGLDLKKRDQWESEIFDDAKYFTVMRKTGPGAFNRLQFDDLLDALRNAFYDLNAMVYVVASDDATFLMPRTEWLAYTRKWKANKNDLGT